MLSMISRNIRKPSMLRHMKNLLQPMPEQRGRIKNYGVYEPDYLEGMKSKIATYDALNIQIKGYDYAVLEQYQKFIHSTSVNLDIEVEDGWALPAQQLTVQRYKPQSTVIDSEYNLTVYERNVQITDVPSTTLSILLDVLRATLPEGVSLSVHTHTPELEEARYVPDQELLELKDQLEAMRGPKK